MFPSELILGFKKVMKKETGNQQQITARKQKPDQHRLS
jgi:hypothetical protein